MVLLYVIATGMIGAVAVAYLPVPSIEQIVGIWALAAISFLVAFAAAYRVQAGQAENIRIDHAIKSGLRGLPPIIVLVGMIFWSMSLSPYLGALGWALLGFFGLPIHFGKHGFRGFLKRPAPAPMPAAYRAVILAHGVIVLLLLTRLLTGFEGWGFMEGGIIAVPLFLLTTTCASYSCAILSGQFAAPADQAQQP